MSTCLRPVVETWGEDVTFSSRDIPITDLLKSMVEMAEEQRHLTDIRLVSETHEYGDMTVVYISDGKYFLDWMERTKLSEIMDRLANDGLTSPDDAEYHRQVEDLQNILQIAQTWRASLHPKHGSLRIYCD